MMKRTVSYSGALVWTNTLATTNGQPVNTYDEYGIRKYC